MVDIQNDATNSRGNERWSLSHYNTLFSTTVFHIRYQNVCSCSRTKRTNFELFLSRTGVLFLTLSDEGEKVEWKKEMNGHLNDIQHHPWCLHSWTNHEVLPCLGMANEMINSLIGWFFVQRNALICPVFMHLGLNLNRGQPDLWGIFQCKCQQSSFKTISDVSCHIDNLCFWSSWFFSGLGEARDP